MLCIYGIWMLHDNGQWMSMRWVEFGKDYAPFMKLECERSSGMYGKRIPGVPGEGAAGCVVFTGDEDAASSGGF